MRKQIEVPQLFLAFRYASKVDACVKRVLLEALNLLQFLELI